MDAGCPSTCSACSTGLLFHILFCTETQLNPWRVLGKPSREEEDRKLSEQRRTEDGGEQGLDNKLWTVSDWLRTRSLVREWLDGGKGRFGGCSSGFTLVSFGRSVPFDRLWSGLGLAGMVW